MPIRLLSLLSFALSCCSVCVADWQTAPPLTARFAEGDLWSSRRIPFAELAGGAQGGRWGNHPRFPTVHTTDVPQDWSGKEALVWEIGSAKATRERVLVAVLCDNPKTHTKDFRVVAVRVDWVGTRRLVLPLASFSGMGEPLGWDQVTGLYLFTKVYHWQPHPETDLTLGEVGLGPKTGATEVVPLPAPRQVEGIEVSSNGPMFDDYWLNHDGAEIGNAEPLRTEFVYQPYFQTERAVRGYFPRFVPGMVSIDPAGRKWILAAGYILETCGADGRWQTTDLLQRVIAPYARRELGFGRVRLSNKGQLNETCVRFDQDGDAYVLVSLNNPDGDWKTRTGLLLHGRDGMEVWDVYRLPYYMARFEQLVGHNPDAQKNPPVILLTRYHAPNQAFLLVPEKRPDGTLVLPEMTKIGDDTIGFLPHSGEANQALSVGDHVYVAYGRMAVLPGNAKEQGVPAYVVRYDRRTRALSDPVFVGFGGKNALDNHNWPSLAADSKGILHVIINGHHDHFVYTHTLVPGSIDRWSEPVRVSAGTTYAGLVVGPDDTLYSVTRCSDPGYYFRLTLHRKRAGQEWERRHLVMPCKPYYHVWYHKLSIDPADGRLFLSYFAQTGSMCLFRDELDAFLYQRPDLAALMLGSGEQAKLPLGTYRCQPRKYEFYGVPGGEPGLLVSSDGGDSWEFGITDHLRSDGDR